MLMCHILVNKDKVTGISDLKLDLYLDVQLAEMFLFITLNK